MTHHFTQAKKILVKKLNGKGIRPNLDELDSYVYDALRNHSKEEKGHLKRDNHLYNDNDLKYLYDRILASHYRKHI
jgi:hypothetical protein